jgi:hypothetical protein
LNLLLSGFYLVYVDRPFVYYEYLFLPFLLSVFLNRAVQYFLIALFVLIDLLLSFSHFYFFDSFNYLVKAPSLFISAFTITQIIVGLIGFIVFVSLVYLIRKMFTDSTSPERPLSRRSFLLFSGLCFLLTYLLDVYNGSSFINFRPAANNHYNIGKSLVRELYKDARIYYKNYASVESIANFSERSGKLPPSYSMLQDTTTSRQLVIILESWGLPENQSIRSSFQQKVESVLTKKYTVKFDSTLSIGGTSQAEARELLNKSGEAYYSVVQHEKMLDQGLVHAKKLQGYKVFSRQGFSGFHSNGFKFRKLIGFEDVKEYSYYRDSLRFPEVYFNHYKSVDDRMVIADAMQQFKNSNKAFGYILTINTHLPFELPVAEKNRQSYRQTSKQLLKEFPTIESFDQFYLLMTQLEAICTLTAAYNIERVVVVGDHPPPFLQSSERDLYSSKFVPSLDIQLNH